MKLLKLWLPVFIWAGLIFYLSGITSLTTGLGLWDFILRKFGHMGEYFILTLLLFRAFKGSFNLSLESLMRCSGAASFLYAISDEFHQTFIPTRSGNISDVLIDGVGIIILFMLLPRIKQYAVIKRIMDE